MDRPTLRTTDPLRTSRPAVGERAPRVLLFESDEPFAEALAGALEAAGLIVRVIPGGRSAAAEVALHRPDLIVLSAELPDGSGLVVCSKLKQDPATSSIPIIVTSSRASAEAIQAHQRLRVSAEAYLRVPFDATTLLATAAALVEVPPEPWASATAPQAAAAPAPSSDGQVLEEGFDYVGAPIEAEELEEGLVRIVDEVTTTARIEGKLLETGFVYLGDGAEAAAVAEPEPEPDPELLDVRLVRVVRQPALQTAVRTAPGRWTLPAELGDAAARR